MITTVELPYLIGLAIGIQKIRIRELQATTTACSTERPREGKKAIGLDRQNNNFARASRFFVHFFPVVARLRRETS